MIYCIEYNKDKTDVENVKLYMNGVFKTSETFLELKKNYKSGIYSLLKYKQYLDYNSIGKKEPSSIDVSSFGLIAEYSENRTISESVNTNNIKGIEIDSKQTGLGNSLTNVHYANNGKSEFDINPTDKSLKLTQEAKEKWGKSVEAWYKSNNAQSKGIPEGIEGDKFDMNLMVGLITDKLNQYPNLIEQINRNGGLVFLEKSTHNMGNGRWSSKNPKNMFMKSLIQAYKNVNTKYGLESEKPNLTANQIYNQLGDKTQSENVVIDEVNGRKPAVKSNINQSYYTNHSGGAIGADSMFDKIGRELGFINHNHYWANSKTPLGNKQLTSEQLTEGIIHAKNAAKVLGRPWVDTYANLLGRNWFQVKNSTQVIAIAPIVYPNETNSKGYKVKAKRATVDGGTGYAVEMAIANGKEVNVFDTKTNQWYKWDGNDFKKSEIPVLHKDFAGIGSRQDNGVMTSESIQAIRDVYEKTLNQSFNTIVAYRTRGNNFLEALEKDNAIGNPWSHAGYSLYKTNTVKKAVEEFIAWMIGEKHTDNLQDYRQVIIDKIPEMKNKQILYYKDLREPSHATALDYLINKYDWGKYWIDAGKINQSIKPIVTEQSNVTNNLSSKIKDLANNEKKKLETLKSITPTTSRNLMSNILKDTRFEKETNFNNFKEEFFNYTKSVDTSTNDDELNRIYNAIMIAFNTNDSNYIESIINCL